jgi:hypothetical protein
MSDWFVDVDDFSPRLIADVYPEPAVGRGTSDVMRGPFEPELWDQILVLVDGEMVPIDLVTDDQPQWLPWVWVTVVSPERAKWWLANGVYVASADAAMAVCVDAAPEPEPGHMQEPVTICGELPPSHKPPPYRGPALVLPADDGDVLAQGIRDVARSTGLACLDNLTPCIGLDLRARVTAGSWYLRDWATKRVAVIVTDDVRGSEARGRCTRHRRKA